MHTYTHAYINTHTPTHTYKYIILICLPFLQTACNIEYFVPKKLTLLRFV